MLIVDEFPLKRAECSYLLTHWHADHYYGLTNKFPYPILCSPITRRLMLVKYPQLADQAQALPYRQWTLLREGVAVMAIDSNHMAGSIMVALRLTLR